MKKEEPKIYTQDDYFNDEFPKEEPKHIPYTGKVWEPPKQETLEEAAERLCPSDGYFDEIYCDIGEYDRKKWIEGAKWQQERSYSKEEVLPLLEIIQKCKEYFLLKTDKYSDERADAIIDVMENFKNK